MSTILSSLPCRFPWFSLELWSLLIKSISIAFLDPLLTDKAIELGLEPLADMMALNTIKVRSLSSCILWPGHIVSIIVFLGLCTRHYTFRSHSLLLTSLSASSHFYYPRFHPRASSSWFVRVCRWKKSLHSAALPFVNAKKGVRNTSEAVKYAKVKLMMTIRWLLATFSFFHLPLLLLTPLPCIPLFLFSAVIASE